MNIPLVTKVREPKITAGLPWIVMVFGPTAVGKNTISEPLRQKGILSKVITATSRKKRPQEDESAYIWMRKQSTEETVSQYVENLIQECGLIEHDFHHNALYGVPLQSLEATLKRGPVLLIVEINGVKTISSLMRDKANILRIFIMPEDFEQISKRVQGRGDEDIRLEKARKEIKEAPDVADFYILNKEGQIAQAQQSLETLVKTYILK
jgi:guanylate kinase